MTIRRNPDLTREKLLQAAFSEIHLHGYQSASVDSIIANAGVTKGALYHHFPNKLALGYAVIDELIRPKILERWLRPLQGTGDPVAVLIRLFEHALDEIDEDMVALGCPLNNIAQEMSPLDDGFRKRVTAVFDLWISGLADALQHGQDAGTVSKDVNPRTIATFIVSACEGSMGLAKSAQSLEMLQENVAGLKAFLESIHLAPTTA